VFYILREPKNIYYGDNLKEKLCTIIKLKMIMEFQVEDRRVTKIIIL